MTFMTGGSTGQRKQKENAQKKKAVLSKPGIPIKTNPRKNQ